LETTSPIASQQQQQQHQHQHQQHSHRHHHHSPSFTFSLKKERRTPTKETEKHKDKEKEKKEKEKQKEKQQEQSPVTTRSTTSSNVNSPPLKQERRSSGILFVHFFICSSLRNIFKVIIHSDSLLFSLRSGEESTFRFFVFGFKKRQQMTCVELRLLN
jgi:hypothetical protein